MSVKNKLSADTGGKKGEKGGEMANATIKALTSEAEEFKMENSYR
jgi:hypothetical protein